MFWSKEIIVSKTKENLNNLTNINQHIIITPVYEHNNIMREQVMYSACGQVRLTETIVSILVLVILALVGAGVFFKQYNYNSADFAVQTITDKALSPQNDDNTFSLPAPDGYRAGKIETFNSDDLYKKIDGKADLYLDSGFVRLTCQAFYQQNDPNNWFELYVYDMGLPKNAFSVFSLQRRAEGQEVTIAEHSYRTLDAVFLCASKKYLEIISSKPLTEMVDTMLAVGKKYAEQNVAAKAVINELSLFPTDQLVKKSFKLYLNSAYGFEGFKDVYSAVYDSNGAAVTAFLCKTENSEQAKKLADDYKKFLVEVGATPAKSSNAALEQAIFDMGGIFEIIFSQGIYIGGVHSAEDKQAGEIIALRLLNRLKESGDGR